MKASAKNKKGAQSKTKKPGIKKIAGKDLKNMKGGLDDGNTCSKTVDGQTCSKS